MRISCSLRCIFYVARAMNNRALLLVDFSNTLWKGMFVNSGLSHNGIFTGGLYGFVSQLSRLVSELQTQNVLVCDDSKPYLRSDAFPQYKAGRSTDPEMAKAGAVSRRLALEFLDAAGVPFWKVSGYEADDLLYCAVRRYRNRFRRIVVRSSDSDLFQIFELGGRAMVAFDRGRGTKGAERYLISDFRAEYDIAPAQWPEVLSLMGTHNAVPGIQGVGPKTALKIVRSGEFEEWNEGVVPRNLKLIRLPYDRKILNTRPPGTRVRFNYRKVVGLLSKHGIKVSGNMHRAFETLT